MSKLFFLFSMLLITCKLNAQNTTSRSAVTSIIVEDNNVSGGGFQSDVTITDDGLTVYSSADVSGIFKSTDGGLRYESINEGLKSPKVASLAITPDNDQILYTGTGDKGGSGGLFRSIDGGDSWTITDAGNNAQFSGNHSDNPSILNDGHPRSNGDLIVVIEGPDCATFTDDIVIAGTYKTGVKIFSAGGNVLKSTVEVDGFVRSVAYNPSIPNKIYAAIQFSDSSKNGIYMINLKFNNAEDVEVLSSFNAYKTFRPEGLTALSNGNVYAAIGEAGIVKYTKGGSWNLVNTNLDTNNIHRQWSAVTAYAMGESDVVYAGTNNQPKNGVKPPNYSNIWRTVNSGLSWDPLVNVNTNVSDQIYGQSYNWWYRTNGFREGGLGRKNSVVSSIDLALGSDTTVVSDDIIYVSGRGGIWKSEDGGDNWNPAVYNMQATANEGVAVNPNKPSQVAIANTDYVVLETSDRFDNDNLSKDKPNNAESRAYDIIFDATADKIIVGVGKRDNNNSGGGEVYMKSANDLGNPNINWSATGLIATTLANNGRVRSLTYGYHNGDSGTTQTILAAVEGEGVFRYHNENWQKSNIWLEGNKINIGSTNRSNFVWPDNANSGVVYLLDLSIGFYRSKDGGKNWTNIWPSMSFRNKDFYNTGYLTADDNDPNTLYISFQEDNSGLFKVYRMTEADAGQFGAPNTADITDITFHSGTSPIKRPGPIVFGSDGKLWLTQQQNSPIDAALFVMENPTTDMFFTDVTTNKYRNIAIQPSGIDVSTDSHIYISQNGTGLVKIKYSSCINPLCNPGCTNPCAPNYDAEADEDDGSCLPCNNCVVDLIINNNTPFQNLYESSHTITTQGTVIIQSNQQVLYSSNMVTLNQNFCVVTGADFEVSIDSCD